MWDLVNEFLDRSTDEQMALLRDDAAEAQHAIANQTRIITLRLVTLFLLLGATRRSPPRRPRACSSRW